MSELTLDQLTFQLCQLEAALELRIGDVPASQIIRAATRRLELQRRRIEELEGVPYDTARAKAQALMLSDEDYARDRIPESEEERP